MTANVKKLSAYRKDLPHCIRHGVASPAEESRHKCCSARLKDKTLCSGGRVAGSMFCYFHDPDLEEERAENRRKGTENFKSVISRQAPIPKLECAEDIRKFCIETAHQIRVGDLGAREGAVIAQMVNHIFKTLPDEEKDSMSRTDELREILLSDD